VDIHIYIYIYAGVISLLPPTEDSQLGNNVEGNVACKTTGILHAYVINLQFV
jgi:hypothetical protein